MVADRSLRVGTLDGQVTREVALHDPGMGPLDLPLQPTPVGPAGGRVLYVTDDGRTASLHVVDASSGADRELATTDAFLPRLAIDPSGATAYYLALDRRSGAFVGIYAVSTDGGSSRPLISAQSIQPVTSMATLAVQASYFPQLAVSTDGSWVVFTSCRPAACDLYAVQPSVGDASLTHSVQFRFDDTIVGVTGSLLIGSSACAEASCDGFVLDLKSGDRWPLGGTEQPFDPKQLIAGPQGALVLGERETYDQGAWQVETLDLTDRTRTTVFSATFKPGYTVVRLAEQDAGAELPAGWFLIYRNADAAPSPPPDFSAATLRGSNETSLPVMTFPHG